MRTQVPALLARAAVAAGLAAAVVVPAVAGTPRGPAFGNVRYRTEISGGSTADVDDYVTPLAAGEVLGVTVAAEGRSALRPSVTILGPDGAVRTPEVRTRRSGASVSFARFTADRTGPWVVRIAGAGGTSGAYAARFRVRTALGASFREQALGGGEPMERVHAVEAVDGMTLGATLRLARGSAGGDVTAALDPAGNGLALGLPRRRGRTTRLAGIPLAGGHGAYAVVVGLDEGTATYDLDVTLAPPDRPKGTVVLTPAEPRLAFLATPIRGNSSQVAEIQGANFASYPLPAVWFGEKRASVLQVAGSGSRILVQPPKLPEGTLVEVAVVNPDGQSASRDAYFEYAVPEPPRLSRLTPATASVYTSGTLVFTVTLTRAAPSAVDVALSTVGAAGAVPPSLSVPAGSASATFSLAAAAVPGTGKVRATHDGATLEADVSVVPRPGGGGGTDPPLPDEIDLSGWTLVQTNSARTFTLPPGTRLRQGETLVVGRAASKAAFEAHWGIVLASRVVYLTNDASNSSNSADDWPSVNGGETFEIRDASGATVDGPTPSMAATGGETWQRIPGLPAGSTSSWIVSTDAAPGGAATPGSGPPDSATRHGVFLREFSDATGSGAYPFEFVEIHFDGHAP